MSRRPRVYHETRASRARKNFWMKLLVWIFIFIFGLSVVGGILLIGGSLSAR